MRVLLVGLLVLTGCGGLDPAFVGTWTGSMVVTAQTSGAPLVQSANGAHVTIAANGSECEWVLCDDMSGRAHLQGAGNRGTWNGVVSCPTPISGCSTATVIFRSATVSLQGNALALSSTGTLANCAGNSSFSLEYNGTK